MFLLLFLAPPLEELYIFNSDWLTALLPPTDICSGSLCVSLTYSGAPGWSQVTPPMTKGDPWVTQDDPWVNQDDSGWLPYVLKESFWLAPYISDNSTWIFIKL